MGRQGLGDLCFGPGVLLGLLALEPRPRPVLSEMYKKYSPGLLAPRISGFTALPACKGSYLPNHVYQPIINLFPPLLLIILPSSQSLGGDEKPWGGTRLTELVPQAKKQALELGWGPQWGLQGRLSFGDI